MTFTSFEESHVFPMLSQVQHDGTTIRAVIVDGVNPATSIKSWKMSARLSASALATLKTFYESHGGGLKPFYFYNPFGNAPGTRVGSNYDSSGSSVTGRYAVRFTNDSFTEIVGSARSNVSFSLTESS